MRIINLLLIGFLALPFQTCNSQCPQNTFETFKSKFPEASGMVNMKHNNFSAFKLTKEEAINILHISESSLKYEDIAYDMDTEEKTVYKKETLPNAIFRMIKDSIIIFVYSINYNYDYEDNYIYELYIITTDKSGKFIERKIIAQDQLQNNETTHSDAVILNDSTYRVFNYDINERFAILKNGSYEVINENEPQTKITIVEYRIKDDGHIVESGYKDIRYAKEPVLFYEQYHKDSDDPMNEY
ncbi:MAG: hypothetical protein PUG15_07380 [Bacteroidales bacterium]|nr:hypothetical protein [Bacteroidales bacterium]